MFKALKGRVVVTDMEIGEQQLESGVIIADDDMKSSGIRSRWCKVYSVGDDITDVKVGQYVLCEHGRWSRVVTVDGVSMQMVDYPSGVLCVSDTSPT